MRCVTDGCRLHRILSPLLKSSLETLDPTHALRNAGKECLQWGESKLVNDELCFVASCFFALDVFMCVVAVFSIKLEEREVTKLEFTQTVLAEGKEKNTRAHVDLQCHKMMNLSFLECKQN